MGLPRAFDIRALLGRNRESARMFRSEWPGAERTRPLAATHLARAHEQDLVGCYARLLHGLLVLELLALLREQAEQVRIVIDWAEFLLGLFEQEHREFVALHLELFFDAVVEHA